MQDLRRVTRAICAANAGEERGVFIGPIRPEAGCDCRQMAPESRTETSRPSRSSACSCDPITKARRVRTGRAVRCPQSRPRCLSPISVGGPGRPPARTKPSILMAVSSYVRWPLCRSAAPRCRWLRRRCSPASFSERGSLRQGHVRSVAAVGAWADITLLRGLATWLSDPRGLQRVWCPRPASAARPARRRLARRGPHPSGADRAAGPAPKPRP